MSQPIVPKKNKRPFKQRKIFHNQQIHHLQPPQPYYDQSEDSESDVPLDFIDDMLEDSLKESLDKTQLPSHEESKKIVLKKREKDYFEILPEGWIEITHFSGMPIYLHRSSRVCTLAKPYYLGSGSSRKHEIPVSAIPCLAYRNELDKERQQENDLDSTNLNKGEEAISIKQDDSNQNEMVEEDKGEEIEIESTEIMESSEIKSNEMNEEQAMEISDSINNDKEQIDQELNKVQESNASDLVQESNVFESVQESNQTQESNSVLNQVHDQLTNETELSNNQPNNLEPNQESTSQLEKDDKILNKDKDQTNATSINKKPLFIAKVETVKDNKKERSLNYMKVREYCEKLFEFQEITIRKFKTWADRRNHMQQRKLAQRPSLPEGTKLITCPLPVNKEQGSELQKRNKLFQMNPDGKSSVCILHEFVQHVERVQPKYEFQELENANTPYSATVIINNMQYGTGFGSSKKQAKSEAAKSTLEILIPNWDVKEMTQNNANKKQDLVTNDLSFFDDIKVEDPRVSELCVKAGQHSPYQILVECLRRNTGMGDTEIKTSVELIKPQKNQFTMKVGSNVAKVTCRNKKEGKQFAAQAILQMLHPNIQNWGSLLRLYGRGSCKTPKEKKEEEQKITELQNTACANKPNYAILNKLKEEMLKLRENNNDEQPKLCPFGILNRSA